MKYELLIYAGSQVLSALDVDGERIQYISMLGNTEHSADDVNGFYEHILDYYNVDDLSELNSGVRIINGGSSKKNIEFFNKKFIKVDDFSLWRIEELLPIIMIQKSLIERNGSVKVKVYDKCYSVTADSSFNISVDVTNESEMELTLEDFTIMNNFNGSAFHSNTDEVKLLRAELYEAKHYIDEMKNNVREAEQAICKLNTNVENLTKYYVGNVIEFGVYDDKPIKWRIIKKDDFSVCMVSVDILCHREFDRYESNNKWENSELRKWLNGEFYMNSFNEKEKSKIISDNNDTITLLTLDIDALYFAHYRKESDVQEWLRDSYDGSDDGWASLVRKSEPEHRGRIADFSCSRKSALQELLRDSYDGSASLVRKSEPEHKVRIADGFSYSRLKSNDRIGVRPVLHLMAK